MTDSLVVLLVGFASLIAGVVMLAAAVVLVVTGGPIVWATTRLLLWGSGRRLSRTVVVRPDPETLLPPPRGRT